MREKVRDYKDLVKVDRAFVVNSNETEYRKALARIQQQKKLKGMDARLTSLEEKLDKILLILGASK